MLTGELASGVGFGASAGVSAAAAPVPVVSLVVVGGLASLGVWPTTVDAAAAAVASFGASVGSCALLAVGKDGREKSRKKCL